MLIYKWFYNSSICFMKRKILLGMLAVSTITSVFGSIVDAGEYLEVNGVEVFEDGKDSVDAKKKAIKAAYIKAIEILFDSKGLKDEISRYEYEKMFFLIESFSIADEKFSPNSNKYRAVVNLKAKKKQFNAFAFSIVLKIMKNKYEDSKLDFKQIEHYADNLAKKSDSNHNMQDVDQGNLNENGSIKRVYDDVENFDSKRRKHESYESQGGVPKQIDAHDEAKQNGEKTEYAGFKFLQNSGFEAVTKDIEDHEENHLDNQKIQNIRENHENPENGLTGNLQNEKPSIEKRIYENHDTHDDAVDEKNRTFATEKDEIFVQFNTTDACMTWIWRLIIILQQNQIPYRVHAMKQDSVKFFLKSCDLQKVIKILNLKNFELFEKNNAWFLKEIK